jgi:predicted Rossmann-fold nucleotide-binding protein
MSTDKIENKEQAVYLVWSDFGEMRQLVGVFSQRDYAQKYINYIRKKDEKTLIEDSPEEWIVDDPLKEIIYF